MNDVDRHDRHWNTRRRSEGSAESETACVKNHHFAHRRDTQLIVTGKTEGDNVGESAYSNIDARNVVSLAEVLRFDLSRACPQREQ
jgi:hypothetical protein